MIAHEQAEPSLRAQFAVIRSNATFRWLLVFSCAQMLAVGLMLAGAPYFATYTLGDPAAVTPLFVFLVGPIIFTMPVWIRVSRRMDKRGAMITAALVFLAGCVGLLATPAVGSGWAYACALVIGIGYAGLQLLQYSMLADTIIADAVVAGTRRAGVLTGIWTAAETVVFALGALVLAGALAAAGFVSSDLNHPVAQPHTALQMIQWGTPLIAAAFIAASTVGISRYDLTAATRGHRVHGTVDVVERVVEVEAHAAARGRGPGGTRDGRASRSGSPRATPPRPCSAPRRGRPDRDPRD